MESRRIEKSASARLAALVAGLAVVPYLNALPGGFTLDDVPNIRENAVVTHGVDLIGILSSLLFGVNYRPWTVFTYAVNEALAPSNAAAFHAVNIILHACVTLAVFALASRLFRSRQIAAIAAALFAIHPIHTEAVTSLVGRAELLAALFGLLALLTAVRLETATGWRRLAVQACSLTSFSLALLSKESALTILPLIPLFRAACRREALRTGIWKELRSLDWVPYTLCAGAFLMLRGYVIGAAIAPSAVIRLNNVLAFVPWSVRLRSAFGVLWDYFGLLNVPLVLTADYSYNQVPLSQSWADPRFLAGLGLIGGAVLIAVRHRAPGVRFAAAFPLITLSLTANVLFPIGTVKAERLLYLPSAGWALLVACAVDHLWRSQRLRPLTAGLLCLTIALFSTRTWTRNWDWQDNPTLFRSMVAGAPSSAKAHFNYATVLEHVDGDDAGALLHYRRALAIYPLPEAALAIGGVYERQGNTEEALNWYHQALDLAPGFGSAHARLCAALVQQGRVETAAVACRRGLRYEPADPALLKGVGLSMVRAGAPEKGADLLRRALALNAQDADLQPYRNQLETSGRQGPDQRVARQ